MRVIKLLPSQVSPRIAINGIITSCRTALREFCTRKIKEHKLAPSSNTFEFDFHESRRQCIKSIDRFSSWIKRAVLKKLPFLEFAEKGFFGVGPGKCITVNLLPPIHTSSRTFGDTVSSNYQWIVIQRYTRFLNYLFRKNKIPVQALVDRSWSYPAGEHARQVSMSTVDSAKPINYPKIQDVYEISFVPGIWVYTVGRSSNGFLAQLEALSNEKDNPRGADRIYREGVWSFRSLKDFVGGGTSVIPEGMESYYCIEKLFMYIPQIIQCMYTLSRKTKYVYQAFRVNPINVSGDNDGE